MATLSDFTDMLKTLEPLYSIVNSTPKNLLLDRISPRDSKVKEDHLEQHSNSFQIISL